MKKYQKLSYQKKQQTTIQRFHSPENLKIEQKSSDSSIKHVYEVIDLTKLDSENSEDQVIMKKWILEEKKVNIYVNKMCREILISIIYTNMHEY